MTELLDPRPASAVVALHGELDLVSAETIAEAVSVARRSGAASVVVDLSDVTFMDSQGLKALLAAREACAAAGGVLTLRQPPECALVVLEICGVRDLFRIEPREPPRPEWGRSRH